MRKQLLQALVLCCAILGTTTASAQNGIPTVGLIPDVIVGEGPGSGPTQTAENYYAFYNALDMSNYLFDEDGFNSLDAAFLIVPDPLQDVYNPVLSLNGLAQGSTDTFQGWYTSGVITANKNILAGGAGVDVRSVIETWSPVGPSLPELTAAPGVNPAIYGLGHYGKTFLGQQDMALVNLLVADDTGNTTSRNFLVKTIQNSSGTLQNGAILTTNTQFLNAPEWYSLAFNISDPATPGVQPIAARDTPPFPDRAWMDNSAVPGDDIGFATWETKMNLNPGGAWIDGVYRSRWVISTDATSAALVPNVRSRLKADSTTLTATMFSSEQLMQYTGIPGFSEPSVAALLGDTSREFRHYFYAGDLPLLLNGPAQIQTNIDMYEARPGIVTETIFVDEYYLEVLPHPTRAAGGLNTEYVNLYTESGNSFVNGAPTYPVGTWGGFSFNVFPTFWAGIIDTTKTTAGLTMNHEPTDYNIVGWWQVITPVDQNPGDLIRCNMNIVDNEPTQTAERKVQMRLRLSTGATDQVTALTIVEGFINQRYGQPSAWPGRTYELYMETPASDPAFNNWQIAMDFLNVQQDGIVSGAQVRYNSNVTLTAVQLQQILLPY